MVAQRKLQELKAARTDLLLLELRAKRQRLERELSGNDQLTSTDIERVVSYLGTLGFEIRPREPLAGDDWRTLAKAAATAVVPALLRTFAEQAPPPPPAMTLTVPGVAPSATEQPAQEPRLAPPGVELPSDVAGFANVLIGRTPKEAAAIIVQAIPAGLRSQLGSALTATAAPGGLDTALQKLADANPAFSPLVAWLRGERDWLEATGRELKALLES